MPKESPDGSAMIPGRPGGLPEKSDSEDPNSPRQYVFEGMERLPGALTRFVERRLIDRFGSNWQEQVDRRLYDNELLRKWFHIWSQSGRDWDQWVLLNVMAKFWTDLFEAVLAIRWEVIDDLLKVRKKLAHSEPFTCGEAERALDLMYRLTKAVGADDADKAAAQIDFMRKAVPCIWGNNFKGFPFGYVYFDYSKGANVLSLSLKELRMRLKYAKWLSGIGIDLELPGRDDIRDDGGSVWDVLVFKNAEGWREFPHLTLGIGHEYVSAMVTLPREASEALDRFKKLEEENFRRMMARVLGGMYHVLRGCPGMEPRLRVRQRPAYSSARPLMDAHIDVDLRTYDARDAARFQPQWIDAAFHALKNEKSNPELQIGARFPYQTCPEIIETNALDSVVAVWIACKPYIDVLFERKNAPAA